MAKQKKWTENDYKAAVKVHKDNLGKVAIVSKTPMNTRRDLSLLYTPGVARVSQLIGKNVNDAYKYTFKSNMVAIVSDGTAILGLGDLGPEAALPVMEGKAILFKKFGNVDAFPLCIGTKDPDEIAAFCRQIAPTFGGINLEDISAPRCFEIMEKTVDLGIPVFHDDQSGTAVVVCGALINALRCSGKKMSDLTVVINGAGAAGIAIGRMLRNQDVTPKRIHLLDSKGIVYPGNPRNNAIKEEFAALVNPDKVQGTLADALKGADVFIGVSQPGLVSKAMVRSMNDDPIIFAMANPVPEIMPEDAREAGARFIGTGRSDYPNQINNAVGFPGIFRGALDARATKITPAMRWAAARALADFVKKPTCTRLLPSVLSPAVGEAVGKAVAAAWKKYKDTPAALGNEKY